MARRLLLVWFVAAAALALPATAAAAVPPWQAAADLRAGLADAESALVLENPAGAEADVARAQRGFAGIDARLRAQSPAAAARVRGALARAEDAVRTGDLAGLVEARADAWTALLTGSAQAATDAAKAGDAATAGRWLLVREFRPPTRFSRPGADATLALRSLARGKVTPADAAKAVRADLLDTYQARLLSELEAAGKATEATPLRRVQAAALARGYWHVLQPAYRAQRGAAVTAATAALFEALPGKPDAAALAAARSSLDGFRAAPLAPDQELRRAGQVRRFIKLVPVEYGRGVDDGRVTRDFELQEAITFRDGAASALADLAPVLTRRDAAATKQLTQQVDALGVALAAAVKHKTVADPDDISAQADAIFDATDELFPSEWREADETADFDVIAATLDRLVAAVGAGEYGQAEAARLEAYAFFEFGPEQRLRGLAPDLFVKVEGYFWYGEGDKAGLVQLIGRRASIAEVRATRLALDQALLDAEQAIGAGPKSRTAVVANVAVIVFREGLEAVLILAVLTAGMIGVQRRLRRPMFIGAAGALAATAVTYAITATLLQSLGRYGERLEAVVSLIAIAILLLILNWFFHKVYWTEHVAGLHAKKRRVIGGKTGAALATPFVGLVLLGFTSVYREGFETVLFLQALVLESDTPTVMLGVLVGLVATGIVGFVTFKLQQKLPYKKMLMMTGLLVAWVLAVMVGTTVQVMQSVGWIPVTPIEGVRVPYWVGLWLGFFPTWQGVILQTLALVFVLGSYFAAEGLRRRRRNAAVIGAPAAVPAPEAALPEPALPPLDLEPAPARAADTAHTLVR